MLIKQIIGATAAGAVMLGAGSIATAPAGAATHHRHRVHHHAGHSTGAIPQHNGGDRDADNNGGPSDGDGNA
jgi:hypothetical protein